LCHDASLTLFDHQEIKARENEFRTAASAADAEVRKARAEAAAIIEAAHATRREAEKARENVRAQVKS
jgi:hypothetical protein